MSESTMTQPVQSREITLTGEWIFTMHGPDGTDYPSRIVFEEIVPDERLVLHHTGFDLVGDEGFTFVVTFDEFGDRTALSMRHVFATAEARDVVEFEHGAAEGAAQTLDRLGRLLEGAET